MTAPEPGVWVSYHDDYPPDSFAVHSDEIHARRFAMDNNDPSMKVAFLPFDIELRDHLDGKESPEARVARAAFQAIGLIEAQASTRLDGGTITIESARGEV